MSFTDDALHHFAVGQGGRIKATQADDSKRPKIYSTASKMATQPVDTQCPVVGLEEINE